MLKKLLDYLSKELNLGHWIIIILGIIVIGSIIIISHVNNRFANLVTFIGSLMGGLITLISVSLTNRYYNQQKIKQEISDSIKEIELKQNLLKYLKNEVSINVQKAKKAEYHKVISNEIFEELVFSTSKAKIVEVFIECNQELIYLQKFYRLTKFYNNVSSCISSAGKEDTIEWLNKIKMSINKAIDMYEIKLNELKYENSRN